MFRIVCDPLLRGMELYLTEIIRSGSQIFFVCLVGVWQRNFEPVVCVYGTYTHTTGGSLLVHRCLSCAWSVFGSVILNQWCVCTERTHTPLVQNYAAKHRPSTRQTSVNHYE